MTLRKAMMKHIEDLKAKRNRVSSKIKSHQKRPGAATPAFYEWVGQFSVLQDQIQSVETALEYPDSDEVQS